MATPSLAMIPSAYADSKVYSVLPNNGDGDFTFNRDSSATRVGQNGLIQTVGFFGNELVTNGDFATDSDWTKETGWTISGGTANFSGGTGNKAMYQAAGITNGKTYKIQYTVSSISAGQVAVRFGGMAGVDEITATIIGTYTGYITATGSANGNIHIEDNDNNFVGSIDNVSVKEVTGDQPRLNYDISNGVVQSCPSLLLEPASTNLFPYSENFSQSVWAKNSVGSASAPVVTSNYATSPDGTQNASRLQLEVSGSSSSDKSFLENTQTLDGSSSYTLTFYIKSNNGVNQNLIFLQNSVSGNAITATNEWIRIEQSVTSNTTNTRGFGLMALGNIQQSVDVLIFAAQLEQLSYPTSYIPTNGSSQTRAAETCNLTPPSGVIGQTEGAIFFEINFSNTDGVSGAWSISDNSSANRITMNTTDFSSTQFTLSVAQNYNSSSTKLASGNVTYIGNHKVAINYSGTTLKLFIDGVQADSVTTDGFGNYTKFYLAANQTGVGTDTRKFIKTYLYDTALTDAQLQTLTTL